jgi:hypothetical protein
MVLLEFTMCLTEPEEEELEALMNIHTILTHRLILKLKEEMVETLFYDAALNEHGPGGGGGGGIILYNTIGTNYNYQ